MKTLVYEESRLKYKEKVWLLVGLKLHIDVEFMIKSE